MLKTTVENRDSSRKVVIVSGQYIHQKRAEQLMWIIAVISKNARKLFA